MKKILILIALVALYFYFVDKEGFIPRVQQLYDAISQFIHERFSN